MNKNLKLFSLFSIFIPLLISCGKDGESNQDNDSYASALAYAKEHPFKLSGEAYSIYSTPTDETYEIKAFDIENVLDEKIVNSKITYHYEISEGNSFDQIEEKTYFAKDDGFAYERGLTLKNEVVDSPLYDSNDQQIVFKDYFASPFKDLAYIDFIELNDFLLVDPSKAKSFALALTKLNLNYSKVELTYAKSRFDKVRIYTSSYSSIIAGMSSSYRFDLTFKWGEKGSMPEVKPYKHEDYHDTLETALFKLNRNISNHNFTATSTVVNKGQTSIGHFYATEEAVFSDVSDSSGNRYGYKKEGTSFYEFVADKDNKIKIYDEDPIDSSYIYPRYSTSIFAPEMFYFDNKNNDYVAHEEALSSLVALLAPITEANYYQKYAEELSIKLDNNNEFEALNIYYYDYDNNISATVTVTYDNFGSTELPITVA